MSASRNADASGGQPGQIGSHIERDEPMTTHGVSQTPYFNALKHSDITKQVHSISPVSL